MSAEDYPPWLVLHVPHDSTVIPDSVRDQFLLDDVELRRELDLMTDHLTYRLFIGAVISAAVVRAPVSRLVVDVERFPEDDQEPMAERGMGAIYMLTSELAPLRRPLNEQERAHLMETYFWPHHFALQAAVDRAISNYGKCLILDCHSFPAVSLPYEMANGSRDRPDICIGTDDFHTENALAHAFAACFKALGWSVRMNDPFVGAIVPSGSYLSDKRVQTIMVEVNRNLYLDSNATPLRSFSSVSQLVKQACISAINQATEMGGGESRPIQAHGLN